ncbi:MAG: aspartate kinase, partial [Bacteroidia bacterium]|nr:aspartate kinase [Bacteroidia bacterium]
MKVFKFGGASIKDAEAVKNVADILKLYNDVKLVIVISAMGKTTNALVELTNAYFFKQPEKFGIFDSIKKYHYEIIESLFPDKNHPVYKDINNSFYEIEILLNIDPPIHHDLIFDKIVSYGESLSTKIVSHYLNFVEIKNIRFDAGEIIKTDNTFKEGKVDWRQTEKLVKTKLLPLFMNNENDIVISQGFIAKSYDGNIVTLGREGSDYSAAILAYCLDAEEVIIWKDVPGVLNADPKWFDQNIKLDHLSYIDAVE